MAIKMQLKLRIFWCVDVTHTTHHYETAETSFQNVYQEIFHILCIWWINHYVDKCMTKSICQLSQTAVPTQSASRLFKFKFMLGLRGSSQIYKMKFHLERSRKRKEKKNFGKKRSGHSEFHRDIFSFVE